MLTFKQFLAEALDFKSGPGMKNSGPDAQRHLNNYVIPYVDSGEDTHTIKTDHKVKVPGQKKQQTVLSKGDTVQLHGFEVDDAGNHHAIVSNNGGPKHKVPFSKIHRLSLSSSWNDELATEHMWNFAVKDHTPGRNMRLQDHLEQHIEAAKIDPSHPLSFENAPDKGFSGGKKQERHRASYYAELKDAAHSVDKMVQHPDLVQPFHGKWEAQTTKWPATVVGTSRGQLSKTWLKHGSDPKGPAAISKADLIIHPPNHPTSPNSIRLSMKRGGGSQLISSGPEEFGALYQHAAEQAYARHPNKQQMVDNVLSHVSKIKDMMEAARGQEKSVVQDLSAQASQHYKQLVSEHPQLKKHVRFEGASGNGKFDSIIHRATHLLTGRSRNEDAKVETLDHSFLEKQQDKDDGSITAGKRPGATLAFRVR